MVRPLLRSGDLNLSHHVGRSAKGISTITIATLLFIIFLACCVLPAAPEYPSDTSSICDTWCHLPRPFSPFRHTAVSTPSPLLSLLYILFARRHTLLHASSSQRTHSASEHPLSLSPGRCSSSPLNLSLPSRRDSFLFRLSHLSQQR